MDTQLETIEGRITSMLPQLQSECAILHRMVYKNKNQHRRSSYFQRLLKVYCYTLCILVFTYSVLNVKLLDNSMNFFFLCTKFKIVCICLESCMVCVLCLRINAFNVCLCCFALSVLYCDVQVWRDLRLLQSANLEELVTSCFLVIKGDRPKQKVHLLERQALILFLTVFLLDVFAIHVQRMQEILKL